ncbi:oligosaccharide flippase family protein [Fontibacter flavus]|uniref:Oligosaccharide flippase family protein n=1 Tax=Fontibacter flavus TaxID=654838 RepID=A0ABV6FW18_9BACT
MKFNLDKIKCFLKGNKVYVTNFKYLSLLEIFILVMPLLTYPYLVRVLGKELYGWVLISQIVASYISIFISFGFNEVTTRFISIHRHDRNKLAEVVNSVLVVRMGVFFISGVIFYTLLYKFNIYSDHTILFSFAFFLVADELLFPKYYFLGLERMKWITLINVVTRIFSVILIFILVNKPDDYYIIPILTSTGFIIGGLFALYIVYVKDRIGFYLPKSEIIWLYVKDAFPLFSTNLFASIKDKVSYLLLGNFVSVSDVVLYDLGIKLMNLVVKPVTTFSVVLFPRIAIERNLGLIKKIIFKVFYFLVLLTFGVNVLLPLIADLMLGTEIDLMGLRIFLFAPIFLGLSSFVGSNVLIAFGKNKYMFYSIIFTTVVYLSLTGFAYLFNMLDSLMVFILITVTTYFAELIYRLYVYFNLTRR